MHQSEISEVVEIHMHEAELHDRTGNFCGEAERDAFLGVNMDNEAVGFEIFHRGVAEQDERRAAELDHDLRGALREALPRPQIKRHASPAPVVDLQFQRDKRLCIRIVSDIRFAAVARDALAVHRAPAIRSEEHTSELQSHLNLVCRLLLEKKKKYNFHTTT